MALHRPSRFGFANAAPGIPWALLLAVVCVLTTGPGNNAMAGPATDGMVGTGPVPDGAFVLDVRAENDCSRGSLPAARCLPASSLLGDEGQAPVSFHALRWLLGTVGLSGPETVAVLGDDTHETLAVAGLLLLAGQERVHVIGDAHVRSAHPGTTRSMSRETVYTAALREDLMAVSGGDRPLLEQLAALARSGRPVTFAPGS